MSYFYKLYAPLQANCPQLADDFKLLFLIPWDHHRRIIDKCKGNMDKALFFVRKTWENNWGRDVLLNWLDTDLYERDGKAITNFQATLPAVQSDLAQQITLPHFMALKQSVLMSKLNVTVGQVGDCQVLVWYCPELGASAPSGRKGANTSEYFCPFPSAGDRWFRACGAYMQEDSLVRASQIRN